MIVCICQRVSDRDIVRVVREGAACFDALQIETGVASRCGCCRECAQQVFEQACAAQAAHGSPVDRDGHVRQPAFA